LSLQEENGWTPLIMTVLFGSRDDLTMKLLKKLLDLGSDPYKVSKIGYSVIHLSANLGFFMYIKEFVSWDLNFNKFTEPANEIPKTSLHLAIQFNKARVVSELIKSDTIDLFI